MATAPYLKLLDKARCTVNYGISWYPHRHVLTERERIEFLLARLKHFKVKGYSREYTSQLVTEDINSVLRYQILGV